jgi:uncharacterized RDD family membrane protein YckC
MKCPKCGYIGFEASDRCRNCGYEFALATEPPVAPDLPLRRGEPLGPPADLSLGDPVERPASLRPGEARGAQFDFDRYEPPAPAPASDLPLFGDGSALPADAPVIASIPPSRPPLAVRRSTPPAARPRSRTPRPAQPDLELKVEPPPAPAPQPIGEPGAAAADIPAPRRRALAALIDLAVLGPVDAVVVYFTLRLCQLTLQEIGTLPLAPLLAFLLILDGGYLLAFTASGGQTIGKMAMGLRVVTASGGRVGVGRAVARTLAWIVSVVPFGLGLLPAAFDDERRTLHDRVTNTRVVDAS